MKKEIYTKNKDFLATLFKEYYFKNIGLLNPPIQMPSREFGFMTFEGKVIRHLSFSKLGSLKAYIIQNVPSDIYCSNAYYQFPTFPINEKGWKGADMIFDIDLNDLSLSCQKEHTFYICSHCDVVSRDYINQCYECHTTTILKNTIPCFRCITSLKKETKNLIEFLKKDFGISEQNLEISFSGNTGFHVLVYQENYMLLDSKSRSDVAGYLMGRNLSPESLGVRNDISGYRIKIPLSGFSYGWRKRIVQRMKIPVSSDHLSKFIKKIGGYSSFKSEIDKIAFELGVKIDPQVTTDIHRIFRMVGSLNGKSGLSKTICYDLENFDPMTDSCFFENDRNVDISINIPLKFSIKGKKYVLDKSISTVPVSVAVFLISKRLANVVNYSR
ncbi:MAG TPA: DNA primase small subunit domain-containing protein [Nitrososphaeraceae archaeon]|nr:DNA primase small subunit domain-containing protein [Nitrososphaeraceae archaeon]